MFDLHLLCLHFPSSHPPCLSQHSFLISSLPLFANAASESVPGILLRIPRNSARTRLLWTRVVDLQLTCAVCPLRVTTATQPSCLLYLAGRAPISLPHINLHGAPLLTLRTNWQYFSSCRLLFLLLLCDRKVASLFPCACFAYAKFHCFVHFTHSKASTFTSTLSSSAVQVMTSAGPGLPCKSQSRTASSCPQ